MDCVNSAKSFCVINYSQTHPVYLSVQCLSSQKQLSWLDLSQSYFSWRDFNGLIRVGVIQIFAPIFFNFKKIPRPEFLRMLTHLEFSLIAASWHNNALLLENSDIPRKNNSKLPCMVTCGELLLMVPSGFILVSLLLLRPNTLIGTSLQLFIFLR